MKTKTHREIQTILLIFTIGIMIALMFMTKINKQKQEKQKFIIEYSN